MEQFLNHEIPPETVLRFVHLDTAATDVPDETVPLQDESDVVHIADPKMLLDRLDSYFEYFANTGCFEEIQHLLAIKQRLLAHLAFK